MIIIFSNFIPFEGSQINHMAKAAGISGFGNIIEQVASVITQFKDILSYQLSTPQTELRHNIARLQLRTAPLSPHKGPRRCTA